MTRTFSRRFGLVVGLGVSLITSHAGPAQAQSCEPQVARAVSVQGTVEARRAQAAAWQPVKLNDAFCPGDTIRVQERSRANVALLDQSVLRLNAGATITIEAPKDERTSVVDLVRGAAHFFSRGPRSLDVKTPFTVAGVRGTEFYVSVEQDRALLTIFEGLVVADSSAGTLSLGSGQSAVAERGKAPVLQVVARPRDAVQWALYYPPVVYFRPDEFPAGPGWPGAVRASLEASTAGDLQRAFDGIRGVPETVPDSRFFAYRASLLLAVGRVDEAGADIQRALQLRANDPNALALQTIIAVAQNDPDRALQVAQQAVQAAPESATARVAQSYAQQARFDLEGARASLEEAVKREPENALAWARLSEMHASFGDLGKALDAAQKAVALQPNLARTQTVLGFAYLMQVRTTQAREAFEKAIALDQGDALPRLGLGLAKIRDGRLNEGSRDIEVAASLNASSALVRSYLGKAYYEEKRGPLDEREYSVAKQLDPNDPTPWFYNAIAKQTTNRPVEALQDLDKAIELNDNRAVYRSRLLLDSDLAARSASLARVYTDLGFQQLALVEGWKSVNTDPTNYSAHRFLADSYAVLPRHEIARVSELLQSQLLQPTNITPIQPALAESNLFLIGASGPGALSFNEFNPIFNRNRITGQLSGLIGENDTYGGEAVIAGMYKKVSFSVGYSHFETDGVRVNNDIEDDILNVFVQAELTSATSVLAEFRHREVDRGDTQTRFLPEDVSQTARFERDSDVIRLGVRHAITPSHILLGTVMYGEFDENLKDTQFPAFGLGVGNFTQLIPSEAVGGEGQYLFRSRYFSLTTGAGYFDVDSEIKIHFAGFSPPPDGPGPFEVDQRTDASLQHFNVYAYGYLTLLRNLTLTLGVSYDRISGDSAFVPDGGDIDQFNPKLGVVWNPIPQTTIRAAAFRVFKRTLVTDQTLEPTQVAGFNQFFDDFNATDAWRYGVGIDHKFMPTLFAGAEFSKRDLDIPQIDFTGDAPKTISFSGDEYLVRAYLNWAPHPWVALSADYFYEKFDNDDRFAFGTIPVSLETHRVPMSVRFFHPTGFSAGFTAMYVHQEGEFLPQGASEIRRGSDAFWLFNASIGYRLPKRYGFISLGVENLTDERFNYFEVDEENQSINPGRSIVGRVTLAFP